jgi:hypothetical protein
MSGELRTGGQHTFERLPGGKVGTPVVELGFEYGDGSYRTQGYVY